MFLSVLGVSGAFRVILEFWLLEVQYKAQFKRRAIVVSNSIDQLSLTLARR